MQIKSNIQTIIPRTVLLLAFFAFILSLACPIVETVEAADPIASSSNSGIAVKTKPALSVSLSSAFDMEIQPNTTGGTFAKQTANLTIATNNVTGYKAYLYTSNGKSTLDPKNPNNTSTINAVTSASTEANFPMNSWGYSLSKDAVSESTTYSAMPTSNSDDAKVIETEGATASDNYNFTIGTLVDLSLPNDTYKNEAVLSVVANPKVIASLSEATYMQEMTPDICAGSELYETTRLIDSRDNKSYWVAKFADGECWMTQNLALNLSPDVTLTSEDTNLPEGTTYTPTIATFDNIATSTSENLDYSWNFGNKVLTAPLSENYVSSRESNYDNNSSTDGAKILTDVTGWEPIYDSALAASTDLTVDIANQTYDAHYTLGNYYMFNAATANTATNITSGDAPGSICPKGWKIPTTNSTAPGSFRALADTAPNELFVFAKPPYSFVFGGSVNYDSTVSSAGFRGNYWSSLTCGDDLAWAPFFNVMVGLTSGNDDSRSYGYSVRCIAE